MPHILYVPIRKFGVGGWLGVKGDSLDSVLMEFRFLIGLLAIMFILFATLLSVSIL